MFVFEHGEDGGSGGAGARITEEARGARESLGQIALLALHNYETSNRTTRAGTINRVWATFVVSPTRLHV